MEMTCSELIVKDAVAKNFPGERVMTIGRTAVLTRPHRGRAACHYCGPCDHGCITKSYFSTLNSTLPAALATGKLTVRPHSVVHSLIYDSAKQRVTGVRVIDGEKHTDLEFHGRIVFLNASTLESTRILLNSSTPEFSTVLANSSGQLGHNLMDHCMGGGATGRISRQRRQNHFRSPSERHLRTPLPQRKEQAPQLSPRIWVFKAEAGVRVGSAGSDLTGFGAELNKC